MTSGLLAVSIMACMNISSSFLMKSMIATGMKPSCGGTVFKVEELPVSASGLFTSPMEVDLLLFLA